MNKFGLKTLVVGAFEVNCYIINMHGGAYIIDPGADAGNIIRMAHDTAPSGIKLILLTHAHADHISAVKEVSDAFGAPVYLHENDMQLYDSPMNCIESFYPALKKKALPIHAVSDDNFQIICTPGHTRGGVCFYFPSLSVLFSGDTIFCESVGRTDLPGGNQTQLIASIRDRIFTLPLETVIYPGHGEHTTVAHEKKHNPFA